MQRHFVTLILFAAILPATNAAAQDEDGAQRWLQSCQRNWKNDRARFCELRSYTIPRASRLSVDGRDNGGVAFIGWDRNDVKVVAMVETNARSDAEAEAMAKEVRIETDGGRIRADGPSSRGNRSWSVSYNVYVPRQSNLAAITTNGGVSARLVEGTMEFRTTNGGIHLDQVGGDVRAETTNGGVNARLGGTTWRGRGLDLSTTNGGVSLAIPRGYNARLETGTTNGGLNIDFPITVQGRIGKHFETQLGSGGPLVRVVTTNGGVKISQR